VGKVKGKRRAVNYIWW